MLIASFIYEFSSASTLTGINFETFVLSPNCPYVLSPHVYTLPSDFSATTCLFPQLTLITPAKLAFAFTGVYYEVLLPSPSCP